MRWQDRRASTRVEDRRGMRIPGGRPVGLGCGGLLLVIVVTMLLGGDPMQILQILGGMESATVDQPVPGGRTDGATGAPSDELGRFAAVVLADTEDTWKAIFQQKGATYQEPNLVLFSGMVESACGFNSAAVGPFYCPPDQRVYIDLSFFDDLERRFGAPGDFAQAYVIAHESRASRAEPARHLGAGAAAASRRRRRSPKSTPGRCGSSCRPTASPACGAITPRATGCSSPAISRKACRPPPRSETTGCRSRRAAASCPSHSRTGARSSA